MGRSSKNISGSICEVNILDFFLVENKKVVTDVALINTIEDSKAATKELLKSKGDTIVYHTGSRKNCH